jgi:membrane protein DedA with SNARE-associated domain
MEAATPNGDLQPPLPGRKRRRRQLMFIAVGVLLIGVVAVLFTIDDGDGFSLVDGQTPQSYLSIFALIGLDAVIPVFPGETTLNAAATLASQDELSLVLVILAGALGAVVGDSALFWIARRSSSFVEPQLERAKRNQKIALALSFLDRGAPVLLLFGRYVPGLRFVINSTMGLSGIPYRSFIPWSALGAAIWSTYTCLLAYWVGSALDDYPVASIFISGAITSAFIAAYFIYARRQRAKAAGQSAV